MCCLGPKARTGVFHLGLIVARVGKGKALGMTREGVLYGNWGGVGFHSKE